MQQGVVSGSSQGHGVGLGKRELHEVDAPRGEGQRITRCKADVGQAAASRYVELDQREEVVECQAYCRGDFARMGRGSDRDGSGYHKVEPAQMAAVVGPGLHLNSGQGNGNVVCVSFMGAVVGVVGIERV